MLSSMVQCRAVKESVVTEGTCDCYFHDLVSSSLLLLFFCFF